MRVHVVQLDCTGSGQCELLVPEIFVMGDDGLAGVRAADGTSLVDGGAPEGVPVAPELVARVRDARDVCPGDCIRCVD